VLRASDVNDTTVDRMTIAHIATTKRLHEWSPHVPMTFSFKDELTDRSDLVQFRLVTNDLPYIIKFDPTTTARSAFCTTNLLVRLFLDIFLLCKRNIETF